MRADFQALHSALLCALATRNHAALQFQLARLFLEVGMKLRFLCTPLNKTASLVESLRPCRRVHPSTLRRFSGVPGAASRVHAEMAKIISIVNADQQTLEQALQEATAVLRGGGVIALPTDTIYGVASLVASNEGVERIYEIKGRQKSKPLAICVSDVAQVYIWAKVTVSSDLLSHLLPGPVTTVFERRPELNPALNPRVPLVGVRIPEHHFVQQLVSRCGGPLALTSANVSQARSTLTAEEFHELWPSLDLVIDGGVISHEEREDETSRQGSTVVDLSHTGKFAIIRPGMHYQKTVSLLRDQYNLTEVVT